MKDEQKECNCTIWDSLNLPDGHRPDCLKLRQKEATEPSIPGLEQRLVEELSRRWWHEISCPAHSNQMRAESECDCLLGIVLADLPSAFSAIRADERSKDPLMVMDEKGVRYVADDEAYAKGVADERQRAIAVGEELVCEVPPQPKNLKLTIADADKVVLYAGRFNYNKAITDYQQTLREKKI